MKNKNKHIKQANSLYTEKLELFESKFVFRQGQLQPEDNARIEGDTWEEDTTLQKGISESRSILDEFDTRYNPLDAQHRVNSVERVTTGVRDRMMQGVFNNLNVLSAGAILDQRVRDRYLNIVASASDDLKKIVDREVRRRGGPGIEHWSPTDRKRYEAYIAGDLFSYERIAGANYDTLVNNITTEMSTMGIIAPMIRDANGTPGQQIDLALPNATNEFIVQGGQQPVNVADLAGGYRRLPGEERVVIKWYEEDFATIRNKCEKAGIWATLQDSANDFIILKMRHSLAKRVLMEEKAKLASDRFSPERLKRWLANDWTRQAFQEDDEYNDWLTTKLSPACQRVVGPPAAPPIRTIAELQARRPDLFRDLRREQQAARERIGHNSLENQLKQILQPHELEDLSKSEETRTLLAYLYHKFQDDVDGPDVRKFISKKAGVIDKDSSENRLNDINTANEQLAEINNNFGALLRSVEDLNNQKTVLENERNTLVPPRPAIGPTLPPPVLSEQQNKRLTEVDRQLSELNNNLTENENKVIAGISSLKNIMENNMDTNGIWGINITKEFPTHGLAGFKNNTILKNKPINPTDRANYVKEFVDKFYSKPKFRNALETLQSEYLPKSKKSAEKKLAKANEIEEKGREKMDSRSLLFDLVQRDLKEKGITDENRLQRLSVITTNMLVSKVKNTSVYGDINQALASRIELRNSSWWNRTMKSVMGVFDTNPSTITGTDAVKLIVNTDPELNMFRGMNLNSSRADMIKLMSLHGKPNIDTLRRFQKKLSEFIKGIEVPVEKGVFGRTGDWMRENLTWMNKKAPARKRLVLGQEDMVFVENTIHILQQLESELDAERIVNNVRAEVKENGDANAADSYHEYLQSQTETNINTTKRLADELEPVGARFKKLTVRKNVQEEIEAAYNDPEYVHGTAEERDQLMREKGLEGFVMNKAWAKTKTGLKTIFTSPYSPITWPVVIPYKIGKGLWDYTASNRKEFIDEWNADLERGKIAHKGLLWRPLKQTVELPMALGVWALRWPQRILGGPINDPHVMRTKMRDL